MGLDIQTPSGYFRAGSYGDFHSWRVQLASMVDIELEDMEGFGGETQWPDINLRPLLDHSDCDGQLSPVECSKIGKGLQELVQSKRLTLEALVSEDSQWFMKKINEWIDACNESVETGIPLVFC